MAAMSVGFTGTRRGMQQAQWSAVVDLVSCIDDEFQEVIDFHHGCCDGADEEIATQCREWGMHVVGHPPIDRTFQSPRAVWACNALRDAAEYAVRNRKIVDESSVMIAAPAESKPQPRGGTWMTIRMALRALRAGTLVRLHVIAPDGSELDHSGWRA